MTFTAVTILPETLGPIRMFGAGEGVLYSFGAPLLKWLSTHPVQFTSDTHYSLGA